ncbi:DUF2189 domain-containing protein [Thermaurantiacus sp.]
MAEEVPAEAGRQAVGPEEVPAEAGRQAVGPEVVPAEAGRQGFGPEVVPAEVRRIGRADLDWALKAGWEDFRELRGDLFFLPLIYAGIGFLAAALAYQRELFPFIFPLAAGFAIVGPVAAAGFYEVARRREAGEPANWFHFFDPLAGPARWPLLFLSGMLAGIFLMWVAAANGIYGATLKTLGPATPGEFVRALFTTPEGWRMVILGNLVGAGFAFVALVLSAFSFPMVVDKGTEPLTAVLTSVRAFAVNRAVMLRWGLMVAVLLLLGSIPLFVGLMVVLPWLGYATWHLYTRVVVR